MTLLPAFVGRTSARPLRSNSWKPELVLELLQLLADPGLRGVQYARRLRDVEIVLGHRHEITQLYEFHRGLVGLVGHRGM